MRAQEKPDADFETIARYQLTETAVGKWVEATRNLRAAAQAAPGLLRGEADADRDGRIDLEELAAFYDHRPAAKTAFGAAGMTSREYATFVGALAYAAGGAAIVDQIGGADRLPAPFSADNVIFYQQHKAEFQRLERELETLRTARRD